MQDGLNGARLLADFFAHLNGEINKLALDNMDKAVLKFSSVWFDSMDEKSITLFGFPCKERWKLNATLRRTAANTHAGYSGPIKNDPEFKDQDHRISGRYEGDFEIVVDYDLANVRDNFETVIKRNSDFASYIEHLWDVFDELAGYAWYESDITIRNRGTWNVRRTLTGRAVATVKIISPKGFSGPLASMDMTVNSDKKDVDVRDIDVELKLNFIPTESLLYGHYKIDMDCHADEDALHFVYTNHEIFSVTPDFTIQQPIMLMNGQLSSWPEVMWERGDNLKSSGNGLKLNISYVY